MSLDRVAAGKNLPEDFNVIIEIPANADPVKYEVDKDSGAVFVDRFMLAAMHYPCNYGYIPQTLSDDGDPADVLVITPFPVQIGSVVRCRAIGVLKMDDESGGDAKLLAVPVTKLYPPYRHIEKPEDLPEEDLARIKHFFEHYKDLEKGKWVKVQGWEGPEAARKEIEDSVRRYQETAKG
ncbi:inorganic diphosphatase [Kerstersia gyiorum]|jgi:inorganic pyrophosphatase|uniref:Inorganic pyrophosphatase n=1 Tax=Kerstersia gyiorum TaxID=206506 RepID=A0A171KUT6_9BURK|nr:inorganic diphosphatase [Kerstersia gyiorum]AZV93172.1 inorganic pyrophosphatase [Bordetella sp. J329]MCO7640870.1 inorganic diphosphatase [Pseudomonas sp. S 311-6]KAB0543543.1 inorganic diphosphatase [Kerstersia gyiorum]KKO72653.1 inorganic pyrophosphatase [Kerstersia gyiorum]MCH4272225.1 inorganic diphosphatase [Kerstersia gyiorum]